MLDEIHGIPARLAQLRAKLEAREGKAEYRENVAHLKAEIDRLERTTQQPGSLAS